MHAGACSSEAGPSCSPLPSPPDGGAPPAQLQKQPSMQMMMGADDDPEVVSRRRARRRKAYLVAVCMLVVYYGFACAYYTQRGRKPCRNPDPDPLEPCGSSCVENWNAADAVYFATVTMTTVGYGDLKPTDAETQVVTVIFILFGFIVRCLLYTSPSPRDQRGSRMPSSA